MPHIILFVFKAEERYAAEMFASSTLSIRLLDINDTPPEFVKAEYIATVTEHSDRGTVVIEVAATDVDLVSTY